MYYMNGTTTVGLVILLSWCVQMLRGCTHSPRNSISVALAHFLLHSICAELEYSAIKESLNWIAEDNTVVIHRGPLNPMLGFLLNKIGVVHNKRFFSPENDSTWDKTIDADGMTVCRRRYNKDKPRGGDAFYRVFLYLFPSSAGRVSIGMTRKGSFGYELGQRERSVATRFIAALAAMSFGTEIGYRYVTAEESQAVIIESSPEVRIEGTALDEIASVVQFFKSPDENKDYLRSRMFLLQVFMFHFFDTLEELKDFFTHVHDFMGDKKSVCFKLQGEESTAGNYTLLDMVVGMNRTFPFSPVNPPLRIPLFPSTHIQPV